jgi:SHS2 domain-containing protein
LNTLFAEAAECLFSAVLEDVGSVKPLIAATLEISGTDREFQLFDWLSELLMRCDEDHMVFGKFEANVRDDGLTGIAWGEPLDNNRHQLAHEVKAITYHGLKVEQTTDGWLAEVIVDI